MIIFILLTILGTFVLVFLESFLLALFGFRLLVVLFFFLFRKIDWKPFFFVTAILLLIFDVVYKVPLGSNLLLFSLPLVFYVVVSMFVSLETGIVPFFVKIVIFWIYYILLTILPNLFVSGQLGYLNLDELLKSLLRAVLSALMLLLLEYLYMRFRKRGNTSQIRLK